MDEILVLIQKGIPCPFFNSTGTCPVPSSRDACLPRPRSGPGPVGRGGELHNMDERFL
jgi:hypothetical protein